MTNDEYMKKLRDEAIAGIQSGDYDENEYRASMALLLSTVLDYEKTILKELAELKKLL